MRIQGQGLCVQCHCLVELTRLYRRIAGTDLLHEIAATSVVGDIAALTPGLALTLQRK